MWPSERPPVTDPFAPPHLPSVVALEGHATSDATPQWRPSLHQASQWGDVGTLVQLLEAGADANATDSSGATSLFLACRAGELQAVDVLLQFGADVRGPPPGPFLPPLLAAAYSGHLPVVRCLLAHAADPSQQSSKGLALLTAAACGGSLPLVRFLVEEVGCPVGHVSRSGTTAVAGAVCKGHLDVVRFLSVCVADRGLPLEPPGSLGLVHLAACAGDLPMVAALLRLSADPMAADAIGTSPLYAACFHGHATVVRLLLSAGVPVDLPTDEGVLPIHGAAYSGTLEVIDVLLAAGADPNARDVRGRTPLHASAQKGHLEVVQRLVAAKADLHCCDQEGVNCVFLAACCEEFGALQFLVARGVSVTQRLQAEGTTALQVAARTGHCGAVRCLLRAKAPVDTADRRGITALHVAAVSGHVAVLRVLLAHKADVFLADKHGITPLSRAAFLGEMESVRYLVCHGADPLQLDYQGLNSLQSATLAGRLDVCQFLCETPQATDLLQGRGLPMRRWRLHHPRRRRPGVPLVLAASRGHLMLVQYLALRMTDLGLPITAAVRAAATAARGHGYPGVEAYLDAVDSWTPLHFACAAADSHAVARMLRDGADPLQPDGRGVTALDVALGHRRGSTGDGPPSDESFTSDPSEASLSYGPQICPPLVGVLRAAVIWTPATTYLFPASFRAALRFLLLLHGRRWARPQPNSHWIPLELWYDTLSWLDRRFCLRPSRLFPRAPTGCLVPRPRLGG